MGANAAEKRITKTPDGTPLSNISTEGEKTIRHKPPFSSQRASQSRSTSYQLNAKDLDAVAIEIISPVSSSNVTLICIEVIHTQHS
jgi:hypothetical protein